MISKLKKFTKRSAKLLSKKPEKFWKDIEVIPEDVFYENEYLEKIEIPNSVWYINAYAFYKCKNLKQATLPNSIDFVSSYCFYDTGLENITIPSNIKAIYGNAFSCCSSLKKIEFNEGIETIGDSAFYCTDIQEIKFPNSLKKIDFWAFGQNKNLKSITFPEKIIKISSNAFKHCDAVSTIKVGNNVLNLDATEQFLYIKNLPTLNFYGIITQNRKTQLYTLITMNANQINYTNIPESVVENKINLEDVLYWTNVKQSSASKAVQKAPLPENYIINAIGQNVELINAYYQTKSNGVSILENNSWWFKNLTDESKSALIRLYAHLGGFEDNASYQKKVAEFIIYNMSQFLKVSDYTASYFFKDLPNHLDNIRELVVEYQHDKDNKIVMEKGFPKIKSEKTVQYHRQIFKFFQEHCKDTNFFNYAQTFVLNYPKINAAYKKALRELNPARNPKGDLKKYNQLKEKGLAGFFFQDFLINENFYFVNEELRPYANVLIPSQTNQRKIEGYDRYLTEAKQITQKAIQENKKIKVFAENVIDDSNDKFRYFWPPITSIMALTIGDRFGTCYSIDGMNEVAIDYVINKPTDSIILIYNNKLPVAYCRVNYDAQNKGILIDNIELDKNIDFDEDDKKQIWNACVKAVKDMKVAMNAEGIYPVERINCKPDSYNKVFPTISHLYFNVNSIKNGVSLEERHYETQKDITHKSYYSSYDKRFLSQIIIDSPELNTQHQKERS